METASRQMGSETWTLPEIQWIHEGGKEKGFY